jgi:hypothetical protein
MAFHTTLKTFLSKQLRTLHKNTGYPFSIRKTRVGEQAWRFGSGSQGVAQTKALGYP